MQITNCYKRGRGDPRAERLRQARQNAGFESAAEAARRHGWSVPTYSGHENGSRGFTADTAQDYARAFRVSPSWLLYGQEPGAVAGLPAASVAREGSEMIPLYDVAASAGNGAIVEYEPIIDQLAFPRDYLRKITRSNPRNLAIISVKGDSMEPTLRDDDVVMLDTTKTNLDYDGMFVIRFGEALLVKRVMRSTRPGYITVISDNRSIYPPQEHIADQVSVIGKVLWYGRRV